MSEDLKTAKKIAKLLDVSDMTIYRIIKKHDILPTKKVKNSALYDESKIEYISKILNSNTNNNDRIVGILENQLNQKDAQIIQMQNLLDQQQHLALQDKKLLEEYKSEINDLKALNIPSQDRQEEQATNQLQKENQALKRENEALHDKIKEQTKVNNQDSKKWYQFWC